MFLAKTKNKYSKGSVLAYALIIVSITTIILVSILGYISSQLKFSFNRVEKEKAFQAAEAGIYYYRWYLAHETSGKTAQEINTFLQTGGPMGFAPAETDYEGIGKYQIAVDPPVSGSTILNVESTGWSVKEPDMKRTTKVRFRRPSWSEYAVLADDFMRFGAGTEVFGKIHSNGGIRFDGLAHNVVSSLLATVDDPDHGGGNEFGAHTHDAPVDPLPPAAVPERVDIFEAGRQFPVSEVSFNGAVSDLNLMRTESQSGHGVYFGDDGYGREITLRADGMMSVCRVFQYDSSAYSISRYKRNVGNGSCASCVDQCAPTVYNIPDNGVIFVENNNAWVAGTIDNRKVTVATAGATADIYIGVNNLRYTNYDGRDVIGLVAQRNVSVVLGSQDFLTIDAALLAQSGRVGRNYYAGNYKNTITVNGSIATNQRYGFAYTDGTGYTNRILNFDNNLLYFPPPYFPTGLEYAIDSWEEL
ncbi:MAG TPA: hypothetical protein DCS28_03290 [Candidatus Moranbacteria bacterium]|nr:hypothetical protein [Candidatus Moranbacteria bacterium]HAT75036.1 hypothetical protein [Candidatus Moranbacteria bacterium]